MTFLISFNSSETAGELNIGKNLFEGDIKLTSIQRDYLNDKMGAKRALIKDVAKLWPDGVVYYVVDTMLSTQPVGGGVKEGRNRRWEGSIIPVKSFWFLLTKWFCSFENFKVFPKKNIYADFRLPARNAVLPIVVELKLKI